MTKTCYRFDEITKECLGEELAFESPLEPGVFPLPANCTYEQPDEAKEFEVAVWNGKKWEVKPDYRKYIEDGYYVGGKPYYDPSKFWWSNEMYMTEIGDIPEDMTFTKFDKPQIVLDVNEKQKNYDTLVEELQETDYYARRCYEYEKGIDTETTKEKYESYLAELKRLSEERPKLKVWEAEMIELKNQIVELYSEEALYHLN